MNKSSQAGEREMTLSKDLKNNRAERPDEWTMDRFIRKADAQEEEIVILKDNLSKHARTIQCMIDTQKDYKDEIEQLKADKAEMLEAIKRFHAYNWHSHDSGLGGIKSCEGCRLMQISQAIIDRHSEKGTKVCPFCQGSGEGTHNERICPDCKGTGRVKG